MRRSLLAFSVSIVLAAAASADPAAEDGAHRGSLEQARERWQQAAQDETAQPARRFRALLRLGEIERDLGRTSAAVGALGRAVEMARAGLGPARESAARTALASALREAGDLEGAARELDAAGTLAGPGSTELVAAIENERGNLHAARGDARAARAAFARAVAAADASGANSLAFRASANALALVEAQTAGTHAEAELARARGEALEATHEHAQSWIQIGRAGTRLGAYQESDADLRRALVMARGLGDTSTSGWALGSLSELRQLQGRKEEALALGLDALRESRREREPDAQIHWLAHVARLERALGKTDAALAHLEDATRLAAGRRSARRSAERGALDRGIQIELVDLLLQRARAAADPAARANDLRAAQRTMEQFKVDELRDYFRDDCVDAYRAKVRDPASASPRAAVIYPIPLRDRLELLVSSQRGIEQFTVPVAVTELDAEVARFGELVRKATTRQYLGSARRLHTLLVAPLLAHLAEIGADTLVFVPSGSLRTVPMAALHDGERFLIERFAIAITPGLELTDPRPIDTANASVMLAGLSEPVEGFAPLVHVPNELAAVKEIMGGEVLVDAGFTASALTENLEERDWSVVHIATHGVFGARPEDTYLLAHDRRLGLEELAESVGAFRYRETPLDLIVLSACETAAGDEQAALGLAGIAVKAGARSAIGTLWTVNDEATAMLVVAFYRELREPGTSRAAALQRSQLELLGDRRYAHPRFWSPFLLISNWL